jgi:hypothetical protein
MKIRAFISPFKHIAFLASLLFLTKVSNAQTYCLTYAVAMAIDGQTIDVTLGMVASGATFKLGSSNLQVKYKTSCVSSPTLISNTLAATNGYTGIAITQDTPGDLNAAGDGLVSFNCDFRGNSNNSLQISMTGTTIAVIRFRIINCGLSPNFRPYDNGTSGTIVYDDNTNFLETTGNCSTYITILNTIGNCTVLPIEWLSISVYPTPYSHPKTAIIDWATATELNSSHFIIERSVDGLSFEDIGQVKAANKASTYRFIDTNPIADVLYYRIRQVNFDGQFTYSKIVSVKMGNLDNKFTVYPNPMKDHLMVNTNFEGDYTIDLFDITGKLLQSHKANQLSLQLSTSDLPAGIYMISAKSNLVQQTFKIVKQ